MSATPYAQVVLPIPVDRAFTYLVHELHSPRLCAGMRVRVPFRNRVEIGYCVGRTAEAPPGKAKAILEVLDEHPVADRGMLELTRWIADYYRCSWGEALEAAVPAAVRHAATPRPVWGVEPALGEKETRDWMDALPPARGAWRRILQCRMEIAGVLTAGELARHAGTSDTSVKTLVRKGILKQVPVPAGPDPLLSLPVRVDRAPEPTPEQARAVETIERAMATELFVPFLLFGVTGSGKTEVYLRAIASAVAHGRQAIILVPEISLTPQTVARFRARFARVAVLHSALASAHRAREWEQIRRGEADVVVGPRSAVFAPVPRLGLIVVDEEHETSYKQENTPRYHARDVAVVRGKLERAPVVLGSATPSLESYQNAITEKYTLLRLGGRVGGGSLPRVEVLDMTGEVSGFTSLPVISRRLDLLIQDGLKRKEQVILFLNRRGFSTLIVCPSCKTVVRCERCSVALTYHRRRGRAECHYCREDRAAPDRCPECHRPGIQYLGAGTERVEDVIRRMYPGSAVARMDGDTMRGRDAHTRLLTDLHEGAVDLLVGTQMVAKGHDVPNVTLVGVISGDTCLQLKDFRSAERTFQLVAQVAGRAGRGGAPGRVIVQTFNPEHYAIRHAAEHDFEGFARRELQLRREVGYPPFGRMLRIVVEGTPEDKVRTESQSIADALHRAPTTTQVTVLGPAPAPLARLRDRFRWHLLVKAARPVQIRDAARVVEESAHDRKSLSVTLDVDPVSVL